MFVREGSAKETWEFSGGIKSKGWHALYLYRGVPHHYLNGSYLICRNDKFLFIRFMIRNTSETLVRVVSRCFFNTPGVKMDGEYTPEEVDLPTGCLNHCTGFVPMFYVEQLLDYQNLNNHCFLSW